MTQNSIYKKYLSLFLPHILRKWFICKYALYVTHVKYKLKVMRLHWINEYFIHNTQKYVRSVSTTDFTCPTRMVNQLAPSNQKLKKKSHDRHVILRIEDYSLKQNCLFFQDLLPYMTTIAKS